MGFQSGIFAGCSRKAHTVAGGRLMNTFSTNFMTEVFLRPRALLEVLYHVHLPFAPQGLRHATCGGSKLSSRFRHGNVHFLYKSPRKLGCDIDRRSLWHAPRTLDEFLAVFHSVHDFAQFGPRNITSWNFPGLIQSGWAYLYAFTGPASTGSE